MATRDSRYRSLSGHLQVPGVRARRRVGAALRKGGPALVSRVLSALVSGELSGVLAERAWHAIEGVGEAATRPLVDCLGGQAPLPTRAFSRLRRAIRRIGLPCVPLLADRLDRALDPTRFEVVVVLGDLGPLASIAVPSLLLACYDSDPKVMEAASAALVDIGAVTTRDVGVRSSGPLIDTGHGGRGG